MTLLTHHKELRRSSNTGRLVARALEQAEVRVYGRRADDPSLAEELAGPRPVWVLAAGERAEVLGPDDAGLQPAPRLIVIDGTWRQAGRWLHRQRDTAGVRWVRLPDGAPSEYRLRKDLRPGRLSTLEAVARALAILEPDGPRIGAELMAALRLFVDRSLWLRGLLPAERVRGGVPPSSRAS